MPRGSASDLRRRRVAAQLLEGGAERAPVEIVRHLLAVQAQDPRAARLALAARGARAEDRAAEAGLVAAWLLRGTLHLVAEEDHGWLLGLTGHLAERASRRRAAQLGLPDDAVDTLVAALAADGPLTRPEVVTRLEAAGIRADGQRAPHLLARAAARGSVVVVGGDRYAHREPAPAGDRAVALAELARRYLRGHGPATAADLAWWSGLGLHDARAGFAAIEGELTRDGELADVADRPPPPRRLAPRLLPAFDPYLLGWRDRGFAVAPEHARAVHPGGGIIRATILVDGRVAGTWRRDRGRVALEPFAPLPAAVERELAAAAGAMAAGAS